MSRDKQRSFIHVSFTISTESFDEGWTMPYTHYHNDYEIYLLTSGRRLVFTGESGQESQYAVSAREVTLFSPNLPHRSSGDTPFRGICIHFSHQYLSRYFTKEACGSLLACFDSPVISLTDTAYRELLDKITDAQQSAQPFLCKAPSDLSESTRRIAIEPDSVAEAPYSFLLLAEILTLLSKAAASSDRKISLQTTSCEDLLRYVNENYTTIKSMAELAEQFSLSESYLFRIFREKYHTTPRNYINQLRLAHARHRLANTSKTVKAISRECGFDCYEYFLRLFHRETGVTPSVYRQQSALTPSSSLLPKESGGHT